MSDFYPLTRRFRLRIQAERLDPLHPFFTPLESVAVMAKSGHPGIPELPKTVLQTRKARRQHRPKVAHKSLQWLAECLRKSTRTVRRYCEAGLIPKEHAWQTAGGHWRVNCSLRLTRIIKRKIAGFERRSRRLTTYVPPQVRRMIRAHRTQPPKFHSQLPLVNVSAAQVAWNFHALASSIDPNAAAPQALPEEFWDANRIAAAKKAANTDQWKTILAAGAHELRAEGVPLTAGNLSNAMNISRATFYRRFGRVSDRRGLFHLIARPAYYG